MLTRLSVEKPCDTRLMRLVGYVRVSSDSQEFNTSLAGQTQALRDFCRRGGHELVSINSDVESGTTLMKREGFSAALTALERAEGLVVTKLDRLTRSTRDALEILDEKIHGAGKKLFILDLGIDASTPNGRFFYTILASYAEMEHRIIRERTMDGKRRKLEAGGYAHGAPRFGTKAKDGELIEDTAELETIRKIQALHRQGWSYRDIANEMQRQRVKTKRGGRWHPYTVAKILKQEAQLEA